MAGVLALVGTEALQPAEAESSSASEMTEARRTAMSNVNEIVVRYLSVWNEQDAARRRDLVAKTWSEDGSYVDGARQGAGHGGIDAMIAKAQESHPGYRLALASGIETHHRMSASPGSPAEPRRRRFTSREPTSGSSPMTAG
jgi:hypothetical protein